MKGKWSLLFFWVKGWSWLFEHPRHLWLVIAPMILGFILVGGSAYLLFPYIGELSQGTGSLLPEIIRHYLAPALYWITFFILFVLFAGLGLVLLYCLYIILCAPFHSMLVEAVLKTSGKHNAPGLSFGAWLKLTLRMLRTSLIKAVCFSIVAFVAFLLSFIPGLQWLVFVTTAAIFAFDSMDYSFEALGFEFRERLKYFSQEKRQFFILSLSMALTLLIPGLTFFALPGAVVGAALAINKQEDRR